MQCALSGETPQVPVVSKKSGALFEKGLIESYIAEHHKDPTTNEDLSPDDLVAVQSSRAVKPRPPTLTSIPSLLSAFQNEWDALMLESYELKQMMSQLKQELSQALYNQDAAYRVITRISKERDEARDALNKMGVGQAKAAPSSTAAASTNGDTGEAMEVDGAAPAPVLPEGLVTKLNEYLERMRQQGRKRPVPEGWTPVEAIHSFEVKDRGTTLVPPGSRAMALNTRINEGGKIVLLGGSDGSACIYNVMKNETMRVFQPGDDAAVTDAVCVDFESKLRSAVSLSSGHVKLFDADHEFASFAEHAGSAAALAKHPGLPILVSVGEDKSIVLYDALRKQKLTQTYTENSLTACQFHPDGHLLAVGSKAGTVSIFTVQTLNNEHTFKFSGPISALAFSENGLWLAVAVKNSATVEIVTLRQMNTIHTLDFGTPVDTIEWDYTGQYLAGGGSGSLAVFAWSKAEKSWSQPLQKAINITAVQWAPLAKGLAVLTADGAMKTVR